MRGILNLYLRPEGLAVVVVDTVNQVKDYVPVRGVGIFVDSDSGGGGKPGLDAIIGQCDFIITGTGFFRVMAEAAPETAVGVVHGAGIELDRSDGRHNEYVSEVGMAGAAEMRVAESDNGRVGIAVA